MVVATETTRAEAFIYGLLAADTALAALVAGRIYGYQADQGAPLPVVVFQQQSGVDLLAPGPVRIWSNLLYLVKAIGQGTGWAGVAPIAARIDAVLHGAQGPGPGPGQVYICYREQPFTLAETQAGVQYRHLGGVYRLFVQPG